MIQKGKVKDLSFHLELLTSKESMIIFSKYNGQITKCSLKATNKQKLSVANDL